MTVKRIVGALLATGVASVVLLQPVSTIADVRVAAEHPRTLAPGQMMQAERMAMRTGLPVEELNAFRAEGHGWGEIRLAVAIGQAAGGVTPDSILQSRRAGASWEDISRSHGIEEIGPQLREYTGSGSRGKTSVD